MAGAEAPPRPAVDAKRSEPGYGSTIAIADLFNVGTHVLVGVWGVAEPDEYKKAWPYTLTSVYLLTGPLVHLTKGRPDRAWKSLALRVGTPLAIGVVGLVAGSDRTETELPSGAVLGAAMGMVAAVILDAAVLGRSEENKGSETEVGGIPPTVAPWVDPKGRAVGASMFYTL